MTAEDDAQTPTLEDPAGSPRRVQTTDPADGTEKPAATLAPPDADPGHEAGYGFGV